MKWQLSGAPIPSSLPFAAPINKAALDEQASPCALYAIAWRETIAATEWIASYYSATPDTIISEDGGHGLFQLTDSFPDNWRDPYANAVYAARRFYDPYLMLWIGRGYQGDDLLKLTADDFNAGDTRVMLWHNLGNADWATTGHNYGTDIVTIYENLIHNRPPNEGRPT